MLSRITRFVAKSASRCLLLLASFTALNIVCVNTALGVETNKHDAAKKILTFSSVGLSLPAAQIQSNEPSFWERYEWYIAAIIAVGGIEALLIARLLVNRARWRQAEEALRQSEERLALALEASNAGVWDLDLVKNCAIVSESFRALYGFKPEEPVTYKKWLARLAREDRKRLGRYSTELFHAGADFSFEYRIRHPDDGERWLVAVGRIVRNGEGRPVRLIGVNTDITGRKRAEMARAQLAAIVESSDDAILSTDPGGVVTTWNYGAERLYGYTAAEMLGRPVAVLIPAERREQDLAALTRVGNGETVDTYVVNPWTDEREIAMSDSLHGQLDNASGVEAHDARMDARSVEYVFEGCGPDANTDWAAVEWQAVTPAGTSVAFEVQATATPAVGREEAWIPAASAPADVAPLLAWLRAWQQHWGSHFRRTLGDEGDQIVKRLRASLDDENRYLKLRRIAIENLSAML